MSKANRQLMNWGNIFIKHYKHREAIFLIYKENLYIRRKYLIKMCTGYKL